MSIVPGLGRVAAVATCPAGSQAIGGGYGVSNWQAAKYLTITQMGPDGANGWTVVGVVGDAGAPAVVVGVVVNCIK